MDLQTMPDIAARVKENVAKHIRIYPVRANYASECGHECERYLYYQRTAWDQKTPHDVTLQFIFEGGRMIEDMALKELTGAGYRVVEQQRPFEWKDLELTGRVDCRLHFDSRLVPFEIKGYAHPDYMKLNTIDDFINSKKPWIRRTPAQLLVYMLMANEPIGAIYLKSKSTYEPKVIWADLNDYLDYAEGICKKLERVNEAVHAGKVPDGIEYDEKICLDCPYFHLCKPDVSLAEGAEVLADPDLLDALERREDLKPLTKQYEEVDDYVKGKLKGIERAVIGGFIIKGRDVNVNAESEPRKAFSFWRTDIKRTVNKG